MGSSQRRPMPGLLASGAEDTRNCPQASQPLNIHHTYRPYCPIVNDFGGRKVSAASTGRRPVVKGAAAAIGRLDVIQQLGGGGAPDRLLVVVMPPLVGRSVYHCALRTIAAPSPNIPSPNISARSARSNLWLGVAVTSGVFGLLASGGRGDDGSTRSAKATATLPSGWTAAEFQVVGQRSAIIFGPAFEAAGIILGIFFDAFAWASAASSRTGIGSLGRALQCSTSLLLPG